MASSRWAQEDLIQAVATSRSYSEVMQKLGLKPIGGNYKTIKKYILRLDLDISHFRSSSEAWLFRTQGIVFNKLSNAEIWSRLKNNHRMSTSALRRLLLRVKPCIECEICKLSPTWNGKPLTLQIDHINGDPCDNRIENLRYVCPNCHTQTDTFAGRQFRKIRPKKAREKRRGQPKILWPAPEVLADLVFRMPTSILAKQLGVSDVAIGKKCKEYGIPKPPRGYWAQQRSRDAIGRHTRLRF